LASLEIWLIDPFPRQGEYGETKTNIGGEFESKGFADFYDAIQHGWLPLHNFMGMIGRSDMGFRHHFSIHSDF
jgi:hypothetical protein